MNRNDTAQNLPDKGRSPKKGLMPRVLVMGHFSTALQRFSTALRNRFELVFANEAEVVDSKAEIAAPTDEDFVIAANDAEQLLVPYGDFSYSLPGVGRVKQIFDREAAQAIVSANEGIVNKLLRSVTGRFGTASIPIYYRHPDHNPGEHVDRREYGHVNKLRAGEDGLYGKIEWAGEFANELLQQVKSLKISPRWKMRPLSENSYTPRQLVSIGLTQFPNLKTAVAVNEQPKPNTNMNELLKYLLTTLGFANERVQATSDGGPDAVSLTEIKTKLGDLQTAANEAARIPDLEKDANKLKEVEADLTAANERVTKLTEQLAGKEVDAAIGAGKIAANEREAQVKKLTEAEDFEIAANELRAEKPGKIKVSSVTDNLARQESKEITAANEAQSEFDQLVSTKITGGMSHDAAHSAVSCSTRGKELLKVIRQRG